MTVLSLCQRCVVTGEAVEAGRTEVVDVGQQVGHLLAQLTVGAAVQPRLRLLSRLPRRVEVGVAGEESQQVLAVTGGLGDGGRGHGLLQRGLHL